MTWPKHFVPLLAVGAILWGHAWPQSAPEGIRELSANWILASARTVTESGNAVSQPDYAVGGWYRIRHMPATVLEILQEDGVYSKLYYGMNLATEAPRDLYQQDWWDRTTFWVPAGRNVYWLEFPGINYRAEIWLNGKEVAGSKQVVGMYVAHEFNVTALVRPGAVNALAVKVTPEQAIAGINGVELGDSWLDSINWKYLGYKGPRADFSTSFVADRNAGIWKPVYLHVTGPVKVSDALTDTSLPLPATDPATLTVYATVANGTAQPVRGVLEGTIARPGKSTIRFGQPVALGAGEAREVSFAAAQFPQLVVRNPDLW